MNVRFLFTLGAPVRRFAFRPLFALTVLVGTFGIAGVPESAAATGQEERNAETANTKKEIVNTKKEISALKEQLRTLQTDLRALQAQMPQRPVGNATAALQADYQAALASWQKRVNDLNAQISATRQAIDAAEQRLGMLEGQKV